MANEGKLQLEVAEFSNETFEKVAQYAAHNYGISLPKSKKGLINSRISRRMRSIKATSFDDYFQNVQNGIDTVEIEKFLSLLTTNITSFFREPHHFERLKIIINERLSEPLSRKKVRIWSAGCSSGQEAYSIAGAVESISHKVSRDAVEIIATDVDEDVLRKAQSGVYHISELDGLTIEMKNSLFGNCSPQHDLYEVCSNIRNRVQFEKLNLVDYWRFVEGFDIIFCRNVVIYFERETQQQLWKRFYHQLKPQGVLFLGQSERISGKYLSHFENSGITEYRRLG